MLAAKDVAASAAPSIALVPELGSADAMVYCLTFVSHALSRSMAECLQSGVTSARAK